MVAEAHDSTCLPPERAASHAGLLICLLIGSACGLSWLLSKAGSHETQSAIVERVDPVSESELAAKKDQDISELREALKAAFDKSGDRPDNSADDAIERLNARISAELDAKTHIGSGSPNGWVWGIDPTTKTVCGLELARQMALSRKQSAGYVGDCGLTRKPVSLK
jgi:hypothetical protein